MSVIIPSLYRTFILPVYEGMGRISQSIQNTFHTNVYQPVSDGTAIEMSHNGDHDIGGFKGCTYVVMDLGNAANRGVGLAGLVTLNGAFFLGLGAAYVYTGLNWIAGGKIKEYETAAKALETARSSNDTTPEKLKHANTRKWVAILGIGTTVAYVAAGIALMTLGVFIILGKTFAAALQCTLIVTGAIYIARGSLMIYRSRLKYNLTQSLHEEIKNAYGKENNLANIKEILDKYCSFGEDGKDIYTGKTKEEIKEDNLGVFLRELDKELYIHKCQAALGGLIGSLMLVGGGLSVVGAALTGGLSTALTYTSLAVFAVSELAFIPNDSDYFLNMTLNALCPYQAEKEQSWI